MTKPKGLTENLSALKILMRYVNKVDLCEKMIKCF